MSLLHTAIGVFTIANPIGNLPIYLSFTDGNPRLDRAIARSAALTFTIALLHRCVVNFSTHNTCPGFVWYLFLWNRWVELGSPVGDVNLPFFVGVGLVFRRGMIVVR